MSAITIDNDLVHYEVLGRGRPVILLHGWLSSWRYWIPTMQQLSMKYRTYSLDLWGYGDSGKDPKRLTLDAHVQLLADFMDRLGIPKAALVGHSLGAAVMVRFALRYPDRVARLMAIGTPIFETAVLTDQARAEADPTPSASQAHPDAPTRATRPEGLTDGGAAHDKPTVLRRNPEMDRLLREMAQDDRSAQANAAASGKRGIGNTQEVNSVSNRLRELLLDVGPKELLERHVGKDSAIYKELIGEVGKTAPTAFAASAISFDQVDIVHDVQQLVQPALLVHGENDRFIPPPGEDMIEYLGRGKENFRCLVWTKTAHFPMLDEPTRFHRLVMDFLETRLLADLEFKDLWVRMVR